MSTRDIDRICYGCVGDLERPGGKCPRCGWNNAVRSDEWGRLPAMTLKEGRFFIGRPLGAGGFGVTYLGRDLLAGEYEDARRAIKEFFPAGLAIRGGDGLTVRPMSAETAKRYQRRRQKAREEGGKMARIGAQVSNVVRAYDCFEENDTIYTVMEYIDGETLTAIVEREGPMNWRDAFESLSPVLTALKKMHALGVYHMDISPDNIMFRRTAGAQRGEPVILDFGASVESGASDVTRTVTGVTVRDGYTPPEQYAMDGNAADAARMDEYAICATLYYAITGVVPTSSAARQIGKKVTPMSSFDSDLPVWFETAVNRGMALKVGERFASVDALLDALTGAYRKPPTPWFRIILAGAAVWAAVALVVLAIHRGSITIVIPPKATEAPAIALTLPPATVAAGTPTATPTVTPTVTLTVTPTITPTVTPTITPTVTPTITPLVTPTPTAAPVAVTESAAPEAAGAGLPALTRGADGLTNNSFSLKIDWVLNHPTVRRKDIASITFHPSLDGMPEDAWDVSELQDGRVMAWITPADDPALYHLNIAGDGGVRILEARYASRLFADYVNAASIDFNGCVDFSGRADLGGLFAHCASLRRVDLTGVSTADAVNMSGMFMGCERLEALDLTGFDTGRVTDMSSMFLDCASLTEALLTGWNVDAVTDMTGMFAGCGALTSIGRDPAAFGHGVTDGMYEGCPLGEAAGVAEPALP